MTDTSTSGARVACANTWPSPARSHTATITAQPGGGYLVACPAGCALGTSASAADPAEANRRVNLHQSCTSPLTPGGDPLAGLTRVLPPAEAHEPVTLINRTGAGCRTVVACSCGLGPHKGTGARDRRRWHDGHRRGLGQIPAGSEPVFGEGPFTGWTWDEWYATYAGLDIDPYTGGSSSARIEGTG